MSQDYSKERFLKKKLTSWSESELILHQGFPCLQCCVYIYKFLVVFTSIYPLYPMLCLHKSLRAPPPPTKTVHLIAKLQSYKPNPLILYT